MSPGPADEARRALRAARERAGQGATATEAEREAEIGLAPEAGTSGVRGAGDRLVAEEPGSLATEGTGSPVTEEEPGSLAAGEETGGTVAEGADGSASEEAAHSASEDAAAPDVAAWAGGCARAPRGA